MSEKNEFWKFAADRRQGNREESGDSEKKGEKTQKRLKKGIDKEEEK